ncbi:PspA/IM30 family protein [Nafulsella turpanensis]|uniref:PspA/IM30 family protein n=1 Tax=Nafulsella turpanensis TaxID=1265690 RepID=UPI00034A3BB5|nr:PspA/IM30 family protein [Nafulsella turpanensis]
MGIFSRLFKVGQSEANAAIDRLEDPIKLTEQGIKDLKADLNRSLEALAEVKAMAIRANNDMAKYRNQAADYEQKAIRLLQKAEKGEIEAAEADRLANEALQRKAESEESYNRSVKEKEQFDRSVSQIEVKTRQLRSTISTYENELKTLKARDRVNKATTNLNKQLAQVDTSGTISMLERMKEKVDRDEALSESYASIANEAKSVDDEIDAALAPDKSTQSDALAALKAKMAQDKNS